MRIELKTFTIIHADEGMVLARKSNGMIVGESYHLGYNYYDEGVGLSSPRLEVPEDFEEIVKPENYEQPQVINQVQRLKRTDELIKQNIAEMNSLNLSAKEALEVKNWYPIWGETEGFREGDTIIAGTKMQYGDKLWQALQDHTLMGIYPPSIATASLYKEVTREDDSTLGTLDNPIQYNGNMVLEEGKYYKQYDVVYLCTRDSINPVYNDLKDLVGFYVEVAKTE
ncbi:MAG: hypothetical protein IKV15_00790 [Bacteroidaceae bacterium]|nr:hypothetical protein [Bacteroidaceae bacterium]